MRSRATALPRCYFPRNLFVRDAATVSFRDYDRNRCRQRGGTFARMEERSNLANMAVLMNFIREMRVFLTPSPAVDGFRAFSAKRIRARDKLCSPFRIRSIVLQRSSTAVFDRAASERVVLQIRRARCRWNLISRM